MGTRSGIAVAHGDKIKAVYCHWDGYLEHNGYILDRYYDSVKANNLVALGDLSSLGADIGEEHDFGARAEYLEDVEHNFLTSVGKQCTFYGRDRGELGTDFKVFFSEQEFVNGIDGEYFYLMRDDVWYVSQGKEFVLLRDRLKALTFDRLKATA
jgi:hypothetical protein